MTTDRCSPVIGQRTGSTHTSWHTSDIISTVRSWTSLERMIRNAPVGEFRARSMANELPQAQAGGRSGGCHSYLNRSVRKGTFVKLTAKALNGKCNLPARGALLFCGFHQLWSYMAKVVSLKNVAVLPFSLFSLRSPCTERVKLFNPRCLQCIQFPMHIARGVCVVPSFLLPSWLSLAHHETYPIEE